jgi:hypothetical protein
MKKSEPLNLDELRKSIDNLDIDYINKSQDYVYNKDVINPDDDTSKEFFKKYKLAIPYNYLEDKKKGLKNKFNYFEYKQRRIYNKQITIAVNIEMELNNGYHRSFLVTDDNQDGFLFLGRKYIFDKDAIYYNIDKKIFCYDYHEDFPLPIKRKIPIDKIKGAIYEGKAGTNLTQIEYATNPRTLHKWLTSNLIEAMLSGGMLHKLLVIILIIVCVSGFLTLVNTGAGGYLLYKVYKMSQFTVGGIESITNTLANIVGG